MQRKQIRLTFIICYQYMTATIEKLQALLDETTRFIQNSSHEEFMRKPSPGQWSKKEILGHLIDSAINNLQRFTEIQFSPKPFVIRRYNQNELVKVNAYQQANGLELLQLWLSLNKQIIRVMETQTETTLAYPLKMTGALLSDLAETQDKTRFDLRFLMEDYVDHMEHHLKQII